jgi:Lysyl oxidase
MPRRRSGLVILAVAFIAGSASFAAPAGAWTTSNALLPDLAMLPPSQFKIVTRDSGRRLLRFTTIAVNVGRGPFQLYGYDADGPGGSDAIAVRQEIRHSGGGFVERQTTATMSWSGDGHDHYHVVGGQKWKLQGLDAKTVARGAKTGFCFLDSYRYTASTDPHYSGSTDVCLLADGRIEMGISRGWGDIYRYDFAYQWVDITGLPRGDYKLKVVIDPPFGSGGRFHEADEANNRAWVKLRIRRSTVTLLASSGPP